jgi:mannitol 2-dehydrogenase
MKFRHNLKTTSTDNLNDKLNTVGYDRDTLTPGILHIGVGNFHRAHEEYYTNELLNADPSQSQWGICGAMLLQSDEKLYRTLEKQGGLYTVTVCGHNGINICHEIGSLIDVIWAKENPEEIIDMIANPNIRIISLTITEGGYNIDRTTGEFDLDNESVMRDIKSPGTPGTVFGFLAEGLRRRRNAGGGPVTILSCDNLRHNGDITRKALMSFLQAQDEQLAEWVETNVTFPNSMVDRITPATLPEDVVRLNSMNGTDDAAPVYCEEFAQWVIEDKFVAGHPDWEQVGVEFTDDVTAYENMKLCLLNASHTLLSYPAYLCGYRKVDDAMLDENLAQLVRDFMNQDVTSCITPPGSTDIELYKETLMKRLRNSSVSDQIARLCSDGMSKFPTYIIPILKQMIEEGKDLSRMTYLFAAYRHYLKYRHDDNGAHFEISEPMMSPMDRVLAESEERLDFLTLPAFAGANPAQSEQFKALYNEMADSIYHHGAMATLKSLQD